jgi:glycine/D-amino acid oxidase-like deaminating enzyme
VIHAFGHGHLGLTLAPITARLVAELIGGRGDPPVSPRLRRTGSPDAAGGASPGVLRRLACSFNGQ